MIFNQKWHGLIKRRIWKYILKKSPVDIRKNIKLECFKTQNLLQFPWLGLEGAKRRMDEDIRREFLGLLLGSIIIFGLLHYWGGCFCHVCRSPSPIYSDKINTINNCHRSRKSNGKSEGKPHLHGEPILGLLHGGHRVASALQPSEPQRPVLHVQRIPWVFRELGEQLKLGWRAEAVTLWPLLHYCIRAWMDELVCGSVACDSVALLMCCVACGLRASCFLPVNQQFMWGAFSSSSSSSCRAAAAAESECQRLWSKEIIGDTAEKRQLLSKCYTQQDTICYKRQAESWLMAIHFFHLWIKWEH